ATVVFPRLAERAAAGDPRGSARLVAGSTRAVLVVTAAGAAVLLAVAPAVAQVFGAIDAGQVTGMATALTWMAPGLLGYALVFQGARVLYGLERARSAVLGASAGWVVVVLASWLAVRAVVDRPHDAEGTLLGLGVGSTTGMTVAGV